MVNRDPAHTARARRGDGPRRATNLSLDGALLDAAEALGIDGLAEQIAEARARRWLEENQAAIESSNAYVERRGLPLARYRQF